MTTSERMRVFPLEDNEERAAPLNANTTTVPRACKQIPLCGRRCKRAGTVLEWHGVSLNATPKSHDELWGIGHAS